MDTATETPQTGPDLGGSYRRSVQWWSQQVAAVADDQWGLPTPCSEWTVRDLVNHVAGEDLWTSPLMRGRTIADVGRPHWSSATAATCCDHHWTLRR